MCLEQVDQSVNTKEFRRQELWRGSGAQEQEGFIQMSFVCTQTGREVSKADVSSLLIPDISL